MLRTWSNGWFTTHRTLHEATGGVRLPCIYGCGGPDSLVHYLQCEHMWTLICSCTNSPTSSLSTPLAQRICLVNPNRSDISRCVVAFNSYHALRNNYSCDIDKAVSSSDFCDLLLTACEVMQYFAGELLYTNTPAQPLTQCLSAPSDGDRSLISSIVCGVCANPSCVCPCTHNHIIPGYNFAPASADDGPPGISCPDTADCPGQ